MPEPDEGEIREQEMRPEDEDYFLWCEMNQDEDEDGEPCCGHCGKPFEEFSDLGCGYCDRRSPDWGIMD
jgi:hypothetical protein